LSPLIFVRVAGFDNELLSRVSLVAKGSAAASCYREENGPEQRCRRGQQQKGPVGAARLLQREAHDDRSRSAAEAVDAGKLILLVEEGIAMARELARGLSPVELEAEGLMSALQELAAGISKWSKVNCRLECETPVLIHDANAATQLYRIAQEAVSNAIRHGRARNIVIGLEEGEAGLTLSVEDDGEGAPDDWQTRQGLGTRIMSHRAAMIGGTFSIEPNLTGGTLVRCDVPIPVKS
jgi:signal transduction histidine kinase